MRECQWWGSGDQELKIDERERTFRERKIEEQRTEKGRGRRRGGNAHSASGRGCLEAVGLGVGTCVARPHVSAPSPIPPFPSQRANANSGSGRMRTIQTKARSTPREKYVLEVASPRRPGRWQVTPTPVNSASAHTHTQIALLSAM